MTIRRARRSPARWLAPIALLAALFVVGSVVRDGLSSSSSDPKPAVKRTTVDRKSKTSTKRRATPRTYEVKSGDVLSVIANKYGVSVSRLQELNPDLDPRTLRPGTRLKLRR